MEALGMLETRGFSSMIEAADVMVKTAMVELVSYEKTGDGIMTVLVRGSVSDCRIAVKAGASAAEEVGEVLRAHVIPFPDFELETKFPIGI